MNVPITPPISFGKYKILKSSSENEFKTWEELYEFEELYSYYLTLDLNYPQVLLRDTNIKHGVIYQYAL
jgi:hypothetical protein